LSACPSPHHSRSFRCKCLAYRLQTSHQTDSPAGDSYILTLHPSSRIPNLPFFYLVYRAWSHWRALAGGKHLRWLLDRKLLVPKPSPILDKLYASRLAAEAELKAELKAETEAGSGAEAGAEEKGESKERMLLTQDQVRGFSQTLDVPALEIELERAIWQQKQQGQKKEEDKATEREKKDQ
jgi:hypothetical protein